MTSSWGTRHGYMDFTQWDQTNSPWTRWYWTTGTVVATATMGLAMIYVVIEWGTQSHLSTENYDEARSGLRRTRLFRRMTLPLYRIFYLLFHPFNPITRCLHRAGQSSTTGQKSLKWTKNVTYRTGLTRFQRMALRSMNSDTEALMSPGLGTPLQYMRSNSTSFAPMLSISKEVFGSIPTNSRSDQNRKDYI